MRVGVVTFPGSNCDYDLYKAAQQVGADVEFIWHRQKNLDGYDVVMLPGGFSYGDYLRAGAIARISPVMEDIVGFAENGGPVLGICNGFQILCEAGLLPGALIRNVSLRFESRDVHMLVEQTETPFTSEYQKGQILRIPIAHGEGNYEADGQLLEQLEAEGRIVFRYVNRGGEMTEEANPNGSRNSIAGLTNESGNVLGMMPHPERAMEEVLGSVDGMGVFLSLAANLSTVVL
ncbi:MAG TPA: phosphoribosylformylglycinamidine synthase subunit PurQ [Gemmatimonadetes bacterium]|jgi:phosphoribosylformylglycinamidine synthase|nr:phosphoribosylformylglycinamidine synthase subunit PurQ [Gemmatimonadota bacterium]HIB09698.1 phosphoribosylformylglycinamidine synthase subunit PurQ [Gemmatimonadota bacterium]HIC14112.1 phosphoribosylformylglycinamidine synthase subunit PurQ [Gemmatimonadota bacterium]HIN77788.1 phosphoribosylformylglycinamidine synthase subunit PurQ [Gemmatimonadota bacterium]